jgi:AAHS family 4-hydroxybenzoate transporter-like MFS transporter
LIDARRLNGFNYLVITLSWLITAFDGLDQMMIGFTVPYIRDELHLTNAMIGYIASAGLAGMTVGGLLSPALADRIGRRPAVILTSFAFAVLTAATAWADSYPALVVMRFVDGLAIGGMLPLAWALNIEFVPKRIRSTVVTIVMVGYSAGVALSGPLTNAVAPRYGWQGVYIVGGIGTLLCAVALWIWLPESIRFLVIHGRRPDRLASTLRRLDPACAATPGDRFVLSDEIKSKFDLRQLFAGPLRLVTPLLWFGYLMSSLAVFFISSWGPIVIESLEFSRRTAAIVPSFTSLFGASAGLLLMRYTDRHGPAAISVYPAIAVPVLIVAGLGLVPHDAFLVVVLIGTSMVTGMHFGMHSIAGIYYPSVIRATGAGVATSVAKCGAILGPIVGAVVLSSGIPVVRTYALLAICPALVIVSVLAISAAVRASAATPTSAIVGRYEGVAGGS